MESSAAPVQVLVHQVAWLLVAATVIGMVAHWMRLPYEIALVVGGLLIEESHVVAVPRLHADLVLLVFLPPLLFDAAFRTEVRDTKAVSVAILVLAVPGVLITALTVGYVVQAAVGVSLMAGLLFGSVVAATDPVAVVGVFRRLGVSPKLAALVEGESLINDGMAITVYTALIGLAITGSADAVSVLTLFGREVFGGLLIGSVVGLVGSRATRWIDQAYVEMMLSTALAFGSYLLAQAFGASGPLACVAAGLIHGSYGREFGMSERTRTLLDELWQYLGFVANGFVFLLVGFSVNIGTLVEHAWPVLLAILAVTLARAVVVWIPPLFVPRRFLVTGVGDRVVLTWGGLRGALTIALALALPAQTPSRDLLIAMSFGVVLFTLVVQGLTLPLVIRRAGVSQDG
ncbi:MAG: cation:proton antiporter [Chloroflexota bacterium]